MHIFINGQGHDCGESITVAQLLAERGLAERRVAVEVNLAIVPKSQHAAHTLAEADRVEIIQALGGG